jgi:hypothetical protein
VCWCCQYVYWEGVLGVLQLPLVDDRVRMEFGGESPEYVALSRYMEAVSMYVYDPDSPSTLKDVTMSDGDGERCVLCHVPFLSGHIVLRFEHLGVEGKYPTCYECVEDAYASNTANPVRPPWCLHRYRDDGKRA